MRKMHRGYHMNMIDEINQIENQIILEYRALPVWREIEGMNKSELSGLLVNNYRYSAQFPKIIEMAYSNAKHDDSLSALDHIVQEENTPDEHVLMHQHMLTACRLEIPQVLNISTVTTVESLVEKSMEYAKVQDDRSELAMLCFFRIGAEILAGELYSVLRKVVPKAFNVSEEKIEFITLHADHDCKSTDLGIMPDDTHKDSEGRTPHADHFNSAITALVRKIGVEALPSAKKAYKEAFEIRKSYMEYLVGAEERCFFDGYRC